jgi:NDP-sugar pyrophosphorylase family protein
MGSSKDSKILITETTAILLCGGRGERLRPFTDSLPKAMVPLRGEPLLAHLLKFLSAAGIKRFVICVGYKAAVIEEFVQAHRLPDCEVICVNSGDATMTRRLKDARVHVTGRAIVCYGDTLANVDLRALHKEHQTNGALATLTVYPMPTSFGVVGFDGNKRINSFTEKPHLPYWINIGFLLCESEAFNYLNPNLGFPEFLSSLAAQDKLCAYQHNGKHLTINTEKERDDAESGMIEFFTVMDEQTI